MMLVTALCATATPLATAHRQADLQTQTAVTEDTNGQLKLSVTTPSVPIAAGQPFAVTITAITKSDATLTLAAMEETLGTFNVLEVIRESDIPVEDGRRFGWVLVLDSLSPGPQELPAINLEIGNTTDSTEQNVIKTKPVTLTVESSLGAAPEEAELRDIRGPIEVSLTSPWPWWSWLILGGSIVIAVAIVFLVVAHTSRKTDESATATPLLPADVEALEAINQLESEQLLTKARFHFFYTRLSAIVRRYIERRFSVMAPERTTDEFLREIRHQVILTNPQKDALAGFLRAADMVKFAKHEPLPQEGNAALLGARQFVAETRPQEPLETTQTREVA